MPERLRLVRLAPVTGCGTRPVAGRQQSQNRHRQSALLDHRDEIPGKGYTIYGKMRYDFPMREPLRMIQEKFSYRVCLAGDTGHSPITRNPEQFSKEVPSGDFWILVTVYSRRKRNPDSSFDGLFNEKLFIMIIMMSNHTVIHKR